MHCFLSPVGTSHVILRIHNVLYLLTTYVCRICSYKQKAEELSELFRDRPMSPLETAVYWTEYVIRHKGAPHLRSAAVGMPWYQYYLIDVLLVIFLALTIVCTLLYYVIFKVLLRLISKNTKTKQN